ncbi:MULTISPECIES: GntR family transcriptional regulator [Planobispora]|uniref:HTH-type transcriptional repressor YvoA n=2 Tax=Planobispora TaxID=29298 RepID=A0A8J3WEI4_PLARO|nr:MULTISPECIES: GntR family transcriptional regulator [Planobispora]GGS79334.1 HTH-type transcriptional repressor YvoA [Planobispora rosea]GIH74520.1 HTH-type transcriptional repressor YvoA [Planobispora longispora]GIH85892.1 HTH-type transcriptional repressor YvoA [Planobispora rosea]
MAQIDPDSPVPKYFQLREILLDLIESHELAVGTAIPSERELCQRFGLSRMTVRQAVDHLVSEGRLQRVPGKGTFVARPKIEMALRLTSFSDEMRSRGMEPGSRDLDRRVIRASAHLARELGIQPGDEVHFIERLRTAAGEPMCIERSHIPVALAPDLGDHDLTGGSLYELLEAHYGLMLDAGELTIDAGIADPDDADLLKLPRGGAVLLLQQRSFAGGVCAELGISTYRADRYQLRTILETPARRT